MPIMTHLSVNTGQREGADSETVGQRAAKSREPTASIFYLLSSFVYFLNSIVYLLICSIMINVIIILYRRFIMKETYSRTKSVWQRMNKKEREAVMDYGEKYKAFLDTARTERLAAAEIIRQAEEKGFKPVYDMKSLKPGDKVYWNQKGKSVILAVIGQEPVHEGIKIVGSHIDSPRLDLKANPVHEQEGVRCPLLPDR